MDAQDDDRAVPGLVAQQIEAKHDVPGRVPPVEVPCGIASDADRFAVEATLEATRGLLWIATASDAAVLAGELIVALGGTTESAFTAGSEAVPVDVSFGDGTRCCRSRRD